MMKNINACNVNCQYLEMYHFIRNIIEQLDGLACFDTFEDAL